MRSKSPLALMEQVVMVLVFALAAALCLQVFVFSDQVSSRNASVDTAVAMCQTAAETLKACGGDRQQAAALLGGAAEQDIWYILYNESWQQVAGINEASYALYAQAVPCDTAGLGKAEVWVESCGEDADRLFSITVAWQEVSAHG